MPIVRVNVAGSNGRTWLGATVNVAESNRNRLERGMHQGMKRGMGLVNSSRKPDLGLPLKNGFQKLPRTPH